MVTAKTKQILQGCFSSKRAGGMGNTVDSEQTAPIFIRRLEPGIHCLLGPICPNTKGRTYVTITYSYLSYDVAVIQWITSCHKSRMTTRVIITLGAYA